MQKFKVKVTDCYKALGILVHENISTNGFVILKGELLEGGTVEKCVHEKAIAELCKGYKTSMAFLVSNGDSKKYWDLKDECEKVCHKMEKCCKNIGGNGHWNDCSVYGHNKKEETLENKLVKILGEHVGETGANEGAVEVLERLLKEHKCPLFNHGTPKVPERCCRHFEDNFCFCTHFCHQAYLKAHE